VVQEKYAYFQNKLDLFLSVVIQFPNLAKMLKRGLYPIQQYIDGLLSWAKKKFYCFLKFFRIG